MQVMPLDSHALEQIETHGLAPDTLKVALAAALAWEPRSPVQLNRLASLCGFKTRRGAAFSAADVKAAFHQLAQLHLLVFDDVARPTVARLVDGLRVPLYRDLLATQPAARLPPLLAALDQLDPSRLPDRWPNSDASSAIAYVRAKVYAGSSFDEFQKLRVLLGRSFHLSGVLPSALVLPFDGASFEHVDRTVQRSLLHDAAHEMCANASARYDALVEWGYRQSEIDCASLGGTVCYVLALLALWRGDAARLQVLLPSCEPWVGPALAAASKVLAGEWQNGQLAFEGVLRERRSETGARTQLLPTSVALLYPLALLAQGTVQHLDLARKFCVGESGSRDPGKYSEWGRWVHAIDVHLGATALHASAFRVSAGDSSVPVRGPLWTILLMAWLGREVVAPAAPEALVEQLPAAIEALRTRLRACRLHALLGLLEGAAQVLDGGEPPPGFFIGSGEQNWQAVLSSLQQLAAAEGQSGRDATRLIWQLSVGTQGDLRRVDLLQQKRTQRGWGKARAITFERGASSKPLAPYDECALQAVRTMPHVYGLHGGDWAAVAAALIGHPHVVLADAPEQFVELTESRPEIEVVREGEDYVLRVEPPLRPPAAGESAAVGDVRRRQESLRMLTLVREGPQRLRLVRFSESQRQIAHLISGRVRIPVKAPGVHGEIERALHSLAAHFQVHSELAAAGRQVASESRLRAELAPAGDNLTLRLVAAPLGAEGPRLPPASGRRRPLLLLGGETVTTERDFAAERQNLDAVLDALPFLDRDEESCEWLLADPENALAAVEALPGLLAIAAVDWPKGCSVRLATVDSKQLGVSVRRERDWFALSGQATFDEGMVLQLEALLAAAASKSRFVPMGNGVYAALTRSLQQKLLDLAAVLEASKDGGRVPMVAAAWLDEVLDGVNLQATADFRQAIDRLRQAQDHVAVLPNVLQATLRPYQEDGYQWAMRLAMAGMGGCLADDMGLGKTLQALAVLLARAAGGPALVIAPTSVCGNWLAEACRFAPTLNARIYGECAESERQELVARAAAHDLVIVSYTLLLQAQERFAQCRWHTVVADEAQAIKNAAAKRSQAVFDLAADFRLVLTGTPVENRLADLWSIMRFANPGLLGSIHRFNERFAGPIERGRDRQAQHVLKRLLGPFVLRRTKAEVLQELPARTELILTVSPDVEEAAHYEALRREARKEIEQTLAGASEAQARFNILAQLMRLRRAACDPRLASPQVGMTGAKVQAFADLAAELVANGHKALVFSQFVDFLQILRQPLEENGVRYQYLDGSTPAGERSRRVAAFQSGEGDLFLISLKAGGFGLNLTAADYVVITDPWWNPAAEDQAMGRAHRIGQQRPVTVYRLVSKGTVEEHIVSLHHDKRALAESILADGEANALPSTEDLIALIRG